MAAGRVDPDLIASIKLRLNITWCDPVTDGKVVEYARDGIAYIADKLRSAPDFSASGLPRTLLMEYCRYAYNDALDAFEANYQPMILAMQNCEAVQNETAT